MSDDRMATLFHPFAQGLLELPPDARVLFLGAEPGFRLPAGFPRDIVAVQPFRPHFLALERQGVDVRPAAEGEGFDAALLLCGRFRAQNEARLADALLRVREGGLIAVAGGKTDGVSSLCKRAAAMLAIDGRASKHHGMVFWLTRPAMDDARRAAQSLSPVSDPLVEGRFRTGPGLFSADAVDPASRLLADNLPDDLAGEIADFGAGWGYLSARLAELPGVAAIDLYEANREALEAARENLAGARQTLGFHWIDLIGEDIGKRYDSIVMNPPFHSGRAAEPELGRGMIRAAAKALKRGGRLFMVANRALPYETALRDSFSTHGELLRDAHFKVLWGKR